ncbi:hypothetical protein K0M31_015248 [Melipona bicolor]|uniref:Kazal-like domain-containing protein n=1 Tax=Melipona bicolor TaxID=60889 RepID=A0AA40FFR6_9HYME|nr:hypothetical protein K0M31_015248 [Melipona bicolor]
MVVSKSECNVIDQCYSQETTMYVFNPVCTNNGFTYQNAVQVKCLQRFNTDLRILHNGGCSVREVYSIYDSIEKVCDVANNRYEWNPVCASDGVTYSNPFEFLCYQAGFTSFFRAVFQIRYRWYRMTSAGRARKSRVTTSRPQSVPMGPSPGRTRFAEAMASPIEVFITCNATTVKINVSVGLEKALTNLFVKRSGACVQSEDDPCMFIPEEDLRLPVCGSDNLSYVSPEALWCAKSKFPNKKLTFAYDGPC